VQNNQGALDLLLHKKELGSTNACSWKSVANGSGTTIPITSNHKQKINAINICIMNAKSEGGSDSENVGARITEFGAVVAKIWMFKLCLFCEFLAILWIFLRRGTSLEIFFKNHGSDCETSGLWVDYLKVQGPFCKISKLNRNTKLFLYRKSCGVGPRAVDHGRVARSTVNRWWHE
jgi:hypothetical protein